MRAAFYDSHKHNDPDSIDMSWDEVCDMLLDVERTPCTMSTCKGKDCPHKYGQAWSPVDIDGTRKNEHVRAVTVAVFDLDHLDEDAMIDVAHRIEGYDYAIHSTHSHRAPTEYNVRLAMRLSRDVPAAQWRHVLKAAIQILRIPADPACKDLSRLYFLPTAPADAPVLAERGHGKALDVDSLLAVHVDNEPARTDGTRSPDEPRGSVTTNDDDIPADLDELRGRLRDVRRKKASSTKPEDAIRYELLGRILKPASLAQTGERDNMVNQAASLVAFSLPSGTPVEAAIEIMRPSIAMMEVAPEGIEHWIDRARYSYERSMQRRIDRDESKAAADERLQTALRGLTKPRVTPPARNDDPAEAGTPAPELASELGPDEPPTMTDLEWYETAKKDNTLIMRGDGTPKACGENAVVILDQAPSTRGTFRFNEVEKTIEVVGGPFAGIPIEVLDVAVTDWLQRYWQMSLGVGEVGSRIMRVARKNSYDPLRDYLESVTWDGVARAHTLCTTYFGAVRQDSQGNDITEHLERIGARWLVSAVARALDPGCQVDTVLVLEGKQGIRKTSAFRVLGGRFFCDTQIALGDKDSMALAGQSWIIELAELASLRRSETEAQKAFFTRRVDRYRPPYARTTVITPRRAVFVGTTNDDAYLIDSENRRYWPVKCERIDIDALERDRDQLWAEAVALYRAGERHWLTEDEQRIADAQTDERVSESTIEAKLLAWWYSLAPNPKADPAAKNARPPEVTTHDVAETALGMPFERITRGVQTEIGLALRKLGFRKQRKTVMNRLAYVYIPNTEMLTAAKTGKGKDYLRAIATSTTSKAG